VKNPLLARTMSVTAASRGMTEIRILCFHVSHCDSS
jgi:hypothetical protein